MLKPFFCEEMEKLEANFNVSSNAKRLNTWWEELKSFSDKAFQSAVRRIVNEDERFPTLARIRKLMDLNGGIGGSEQTDAEKAESCLRYHIRGLCGEKRGTLPICKSCQSRELPDARPETISEMLHKSFDKRSIADKLRVYELFQQRIKQECIEDKKLYRTARSSD